MKSPSSQKLRHISFRLWMSKSSSTAFSALRPVLESLPHIHDEYLHQESNSRDHTKLYDLTFWHKERPQVGLFSAAIWRINGVALEEYGLHKGQNNGRCDIWFRAGAANFESEAKFCWLPGCRKRDGGISDMWMSTFKDYLGKAKWSASQLTTFPNRLAIVFGAITVEPQLARGDFISEITDKMKPLLGGRNAALLLMSLNDDQSPPRLKARRSSKSSDKSPECVGMLVFVTPCERRISPKQVKLHGAPR